MLDIESAIVHSHDKFWMKALCKVLKWYYLLVSARSMPNRVRCDIFVGALHQLRFRKNPEVIALFGGMRDAPERIAELVEERKDRFFFVGGNVEEHTFYLKRLGELGILNFISLSGVTNTCDEAKKALSLSNAFKAKSIGVLTSEFHATRALLTCVKVAIGMDIHIPIIPIIYMDSNRYKIPDDIASVGILREAMKLAYWQKRGHVATYDEAKEYFRSWLELKGKKTVLR